MDALFAAVLLPLNMIAWTAFFVVGALMMAKRVPAAQMGGPFVSIGILFTFAGILSALLGFDTADLDSSVPALLDGMKTAFLSSVVGMGLAIATRIASIVASGEDGESGPTGEQFIAVMRAQQQTLESIEKSMGGDGDHSMLTQLRLANGTLDGLRAETAGMRSDLNTFAAKLSEQSTDAIITALENVIRDFNAQLNEQFGDNFKQLNQGVERLVGWMDQHQTLVTASHQALDQATATLAQAARSLEISAESMSQIEQASSAVHRTTRDTASALSDTSSALQELSGDTTTLAQSATSLHGAVTALSASSDALAKGLDSWSQLASESEGATAQIRSMVKTVETHADAVTAQHNYLIQRLQQRTDRMSTALMAAQKEFFTTQKAQMTAIVEQQGKAMLAAHRAVMEQARQDLQRSGERNHETVRKQVDALDKALQDELTKALNAIGGKLASLSEKFAADYRPLTEQLGRVVRLADDIDRQRGGRRG